MKIAVIGEGKLMLTDIAKEMSSMIVEGAMLHINGKIYTTTVMSGDSAELTEMTLNSMELKVAEQRQRLRSINAGIAHLAYEPEPLIEKDKKFYDHFYKPNKNRRR